MDPDGRPEDHREYEDMAVAHVMGGLDIEQGQVFRAHLLDCSECRARVGELRAIAHELAGIERNERRVRSAKAVDIKSREDEGEQAPVERRRKGWGIRLVVFGAVLGLVMLSAYVFTLRAQIASLEREVAQREAASAALEHGRELSIIHTAPEVGSATAKRHEDDLVVLLEGLDDAVVYGLYLVDENNRTVFRRPHSTDDGRLFLLFGLDGSEERFIITRSSNGFGSEPTGATIFESHLARYADE